MMIRYLFVSSELISFHQSIDNWNEYGIEATLRDWTSETLGMEDRYCHRLAIQKLFRFKFIFKYYTGDRVYNSDHDPGGSNFFMFQQGSNSLPIEKKDSFRFCSQNLSQSQSNYWLVRFHSSSNLNRFNTFRENLVHHRHCFTKRKRKFISSNQLFCYSR